MGAPGGEVLDMELWRMWTSEIKPHFSGEAEFLLKYGENAGYEPIHIARILSDHQLLERLVWRKGNEGVLQFAKVLDAHLRYKEEIFINRVRQITEEDSCLNFS